VATAHGLQPEQQQTASNQSASSATGKQQQANSVEQNQALIRLLVQELWNKHDLTTVDKYYSANYTEHAKQHGAGRDGVKEYWSAIFRGFPDWHVTVDLTSVGDKVPAIFNRNGTQTGEYVGNPPNGDKVTAQTIEPFRVINGYVPEHWDVQGDLAFLIAPAE